MPIVVKSSEKQPDLATQDDATQPEVSASPLALGEARRALDEAIRARAWGAVEAIAARVRELEREGVVDLDERRRERG